MFAKTAIADWRRTADNRGQNADQALRSGLRIWQAIATSPEARTDLVQSAYQSELHRVADPASLERYREAWEHAADRTPHGTPIELRPEDFR